MAGIVAASRSAPTGRRDDDHRTHGTVVAVRRWCAAIVLSAALAAGCSNGVELAGVEATLPGEVGRDDSASAGAFTEVDEPVSFVWSDAPLAIRWRRPERCADPVRVAVGAATTPFEVGTGWVTANVSSSGGRVRIDPGGCPLQVDHLTAVPRPYAGRALWTPPVPHDGVPAAIAATPTAVWLTDPEGAVSLADDSVAAAAAEGTVPVLVLYLRPGRDCGGHSAGGADPDGYLEVVDELAGVLEGHDAVVIVEPDATALDCGDPSVVAEATRRLGSVDGPRVYLDGGHPGWHPPAEQAARLTEAGVGAADGFAVGVSNFVPVDELVSYGDEINTHLGLPYVIDVSRSGAPVPDGQWCNPPAARIGPAPTLEAPHPLVDAQLWVKRPGESDGTCGGAPPAGEWWPEGARRLLQGTALLAGR